MLLVEGGVDCTLELELRRFCRVYVGGDDGVDAVMTGGGAGS